MQTHEISIANESDLAFLNNIELAAASIFPSAVLPEKVRAETVPQKILAEAIRLGRLFVCRNQAGFPVGYAFWQAQGEAALLAQIDVLPEYGKCGRGKALVENIISDVVMANYQSLYLTTFEDIPWNAPFYQKLGFTILTEKEQPLFIKHILTDEQNRGMNNRVAMGIIGL